MLSAGVRSLKHAANRRRSRPYGLIALMMSAMAWAAKRSPSMTMVKEAAPTIHLRSEGLMPRTLIFRMLSSTLALASAYGSVSG